MQFGRSRRGVTVLVIVFVGLVAVGNAYADTRAISDGNDRLGPLDIRSARHAHDGARVVHTISTFSTWRVGLLGLNTPNLFALEISTDADPALERSGPHLLRERSHGRARLQTAGWRLHRVRGRLEAQRPNRARVHSPLSTRKPGRLPLEGALPVQGGRRAAAAASTKRPTSAASSTTSRPRPSC